MNPFRITTDLGIKLNYTNVIGAFVLNDNVIEVELLTLPVEKSKNFIVSENIDLNPLICALLGANVSIVIEAGEYPISYNKNPFGSIKLKISKTLQQPDNEIFDRWGNNPYYADGDIIAYEVKDNTVVDSSNVNMDKQVRYYSQNIGCYPNYRMHRVLCEIGHNMIDCARNWCNLNREYK